MSDHKEATRRDFLKGTTLAAAGFALAGGLNVARTAHAAGSDELKIVLIGCGGRGTGAVKNCLDAVKNVKLIAVADAFEDRAKGCVETLKKKYGDKIDVPEDRVFRRLRRLSEGDRRRPRRGVDRHSARFPSHPLCRRRCRQQARLHGKAVLHRRPRLPLLAWKPTSWPTRRTSRLWSACSAITDKGYIEGIKKIHDGAIGDLILLRAYWNGRQHLVPSAPARSNRNGIPDAELVPLRLAVRRQHLRATRSQPGRLQLGQGRPSRSRANGMGACVRRYDGLDRRRRLGQIFDEHFVEFTYADGSKLYSQCRQIARHLGRRFRGGSRHEGRRRSAIRVRGGRNPLRTRARRLVRRHPQEREAQRWLVRRHQQLYRGAGPHGNLLRASGQLGRGGGEAGRARCLPSSPSTPIRPSSPTPTATTRFPSPASTNRIEDSATRRIQPSGWGLVHFSATRGIWRQSLGRKHGPAPFPRRISPLRAGVALAPVDAWAAFGDPIIDGDRRTRRSECCQGCACPVQAIGRLQQGVLLVALEVLALHSHIHAAVDLAEHVQSDLRRAGMALHPLDGDTIVAMLIVGERKSILQ